MKKEKEIILSDILPKFKSLSEFREFFPTEQSCIDYLEWHLWKGKPVSPFDPTSQVYKCKSRKNWYKCRNTNKYFNVRTATKELKYSKIPLRQWFYTFYVMATRKRGVPSQQLADDIGVTQTSAWNLLKDVRNILKQSNFIKSKLKNEWEGDEVYLGGSNPNRHKDKQVPRCQGRNWKDKIPVLVMEQRGGYAIAQVTPNVKRKTLFPIIRANAEEDSSAYTDEYPVYKGLDKWYNHQIVVHKKKQYTKKYEGGKASTNLVENFNSHLNKMIYGTHIKIKREYAQGYLDEFVFRRNTRKYSIQDRFDLIVLSALGKPLAYEEFNCMRS